MSKFYLVIVKNREGRKLFFFFEIENAIMREVDSHLRLDFDLAVADADQCRTIWEKFREEEPRV